jgi:nucleotide-binding universal stress UspA family protein
VAGIVVGYDGTDSSKAALDAAIALAKDLGDPILAVFGYAVTPIGGEVKNHAEALKEMGETATAEAVERARGSGATAEAVLVDEEGPDALIAVAKDRSARMIVVGSHGEGPVRGAILGSTPYHLVSRSETPVLVVRTQG